MMATPEGGFLPEARRRHPVDAGVLLGLWSACLLLIPGTLVVGALGAAGSPAQLLGLVALVWWFGVQLDRATANLTPAQPIRRAMIAFVIAILISYVVAASRPIDDLELRSADRGVLLALSWLGIVLLTADGVSSRARLDTLLRRIAAMAGLAALLGILQFFTGLAFIDKLSIPGLVANQDLTSVYNRNGFARAAGTATHPIEFGVMLTMALPIALHYALTDENRARIRRWLPVALISIAIPITISRSALLGLAIGLIILFPAWPVARRRAAYLLMVLGLAALYVVIPGLLGTLGKLFTGVGNDNSALSRTNSYELAWQFIKKSPVFGRGVSTFLPEYRILDNQYLGLLIETGVLGCMAFLALLITGLAVGRRLVRTSSRRPVVASLARSLVASLAAAAFSYATFDGFGFQQVAGLTFFVLGSLSSLSRMLTPPPAFPGDSGLGVIRGTPNGAVRTQGLRRALRRVNSARPAQGTAPGSG